MFYEFNILFNDFFVNTSNVLFFYSLLCTKKDEKNNNIFSSFVYFD